MTSPGHIIVTGVVLLANPRSVDSTKGTRNVVLDVNFPVKDGKKRTLGLLRYFTPEDRVLEIQKIWEENFTEAFIVAKIATMPKVGIPSHLIAEDDPNDYAFVGDITEIIIAQGANIHRNPYIIATGTVTSFDNTHLTFSMTPSQYINLPHSILGFSIHCFIDPESKKWKNKKPLPNTGSVVSIGGFLSKVKRNDDKEPTFEIELDSIAYLNRQTPSSPNFAPDSSTSTAISRNRFDYDKILPTTSFSSPLSTEKRKKTDTESDTLSENELSPKRLHKDIKE